MKGTPTEPTAAPRRSIPSVEKVLQGIGDAGLPRPVVVAEVRRYLAALRAQRGDAGAKAGEAAGFDAIVGAVRENLESLGRTRLQPVINGTGVLIHTNLGRSPLGPEVAETLREIAASYNNLELDLRTGKRGRRAGFLEHQLAILCGAEAATVVNNCASALVLILRHFTAPGRDEVIISRGELVEIGGGFRIPDILETSGARLREVGATNKTSLEDYAGALSERTALVLKVHRSNFFMEGFVASPDTRQLAALARKHGVPFVEDLGSGAVVPTDQLGPVEHEPTPAEVIRGGIELVCCSGDKLFGGPQAGIIAGAAQHVAALKKDPFYRALRCDKLILAVLQETVSRYLDGPAAADPAAKAGDGGGIEPPRPSIAPAGIPVLEMLAADPADLRARGEIIAGALNGAEVPAAVSLGEADGQIGGGTLPRSRIPSVTLDLAPKNLRLAEFADRLRAGTPPVVGYVADGRFRLDLRTVLPGQDETLTAALVAALGGG